MSVPICPRPVRAALLALLALLATTLISGCSSSASGTAGPPADPCAVLSDQDVTGAGGQPVRGRNVHHYPGTTVPYDECEWTGSVAWVGRLDVYRERSADVLANWRTSIAAVDRGLPAPAVGDEALWTQPLPGATGVMLRSGVAAYHVILIKDGAPFADAAERSRFRDATVALARSVVDRTR